MKAFVQSFTQALRSEVKDQGITVTALLQGATDTDFFNKAGMNGSKAAEDKDAIADPEEVAKEGCNALIEGKDLVIETVKVLSEIPIVYLQNLMGKFGTDLWRKANGIDESPRDPLP